MLSILIPVYNFDIRDLVEGLHDQCKATEIEFEILCFDDGSVIEFQDNNRSIKSLSEVVYKELKNNVGRSKIRNLLAAAARYDFLLFMDCDSGLVKENYIANYISVLSAESVLYGGRVYKNMPPEKREYYFHWKYGREREQSTAEERKRRPYHGFMTNNFLMPMSLFQEIGFDERLTQYGHEDTLFGLELKKRNIPIVHVDNPLEHLGLEFATVFLDKTQKGIANLYFLSLDNELIETKLLRVFKKLKRLNLLGLINLLLLPLRNWMIRNLYSSNPQMRIFDLYKLSLLIEESSKKNKPQ